MMAFPALPNLNRKRTTALDLNVHLRKPSSLLNLTRILFLIVLVPHVLYSEGTLRIGATPAAFSPNSDGIQDSTEIQVLSAPDELDQPADFVLKISADTGVIRTFRADARWIRPVRSIRNLFLPSVESIRPIRLFDAWTWDGLDDWGKTVADGSYKVQLTVMDGTGQLKISNETIVEVNTRRPQLAISLASNMLVRPVGAEGKPSDKIQGQISIEQNAVADSGTEFVGRVVDVHGLVVEERNWKGALPGRFVWDGKTKDGKVAPWGSYFYRLSARSPSGNITEESLAGLLVWQENPEIDLQTDEVFSPNGDGQKDKLQLFVSFTSTSLRNAVRSWRLQIFSEEKPELILYDFVSPKNLPGVIVWDGLDNNRMLAPDGIYIARLLVDTPSGSRTSAPRSFRLFTAAPRIEFTLGNTIFAPDGSGENGDLPIRVRMKDEAGIESWSLRIFCTPSGNRARKLLKTWQGIRAPESIVWNGSGDKADVVESLEYLTVVLEAKNRSGNSARPEIATIRADVLMRAMQPGQRPLFSRIPIQDFFDREGRLTVSGSDAMDRIAAKLSRYRRYRLHVYVNAGLKGREEDNLEITERRAHSVYQRLRISWPADRIDFQGLGESEVLSTAEDEFMQYRNERIELKLVEP